MCFFFKNKGLILLVIVYNLDTHYFKLGELNKKKFKFTSIILNFTKCLLLALFNIRNLKILLLILMKLLENY